MVIKCQRCGDKLPTLNPRRMWCFECRRVINLERIKTKKNQRK